MIFNLTIFLILVLSVTNLIFNIGIAYFLVKMADRLFDGFEQEQETPEQDKSPIQLYEEAVERLETENALVDLPMPKIR
jgi:hypothetical protein